MACPVVKVFAEASSSSGGFGARDICDIGGEGEIVGGPSVGCLGCEAPVCVPMFQVLLMMVVSGVGAKGLESGFALKVPYPGSCGYDVVEERVKVDVI